MREELDKALVEKYPLIFRNRYAPMTHTAMCWGFDHGDGWYNIIDTLCGLMYSDYNNAKHSYEFAKECIEERNGEMPWKGGTKITAEDLEEKRLAMEEAAERVPVASQVKEKYGTLRFYIDRGTDTHYNYISFAEWMSAKTCEECGKPGRTYHMGWHRTLCDEHADENYGEDAADFRNKTGQWADDEGDE